jgi:hypothetical protein
MNGPFERFQSAEKNRDAGTSRDFEPAGKEAMDHNVQEPTMIPKCSQRQLRTERAEIAIQTEVDSEPSGRVHHDREGQRSMWHDSPSTYYMHSVRLYNCTHMS